MMLIPLIFFLPQSDRLQILSQNEFELLWGLPSFSPEDCELLFTITPREESVLSRLRTAKTKVYFLLCLGYFRARQRFYRFESEMVSSDVQFLVKRYLPNNDVNDFNDVNDLRVSDHTRLQHTERILELFGYRLCNQEAKLLLEDLALSAAQVSSRPVYVLRDLVDYLRQSRTVLPGYTYLQDVVRRALAFERIRVSDALNSVSAKSMPTC